ncbi:biotin holocarboxylase synthetase [Friedmanniomyces endolithicus]|uniref:Biotin holocarboxylase synthetase n=1 Tax=Friedmanniomyces endolithicus TaxID=329885 RepID=A0AAN6QKX3_9PEZI|nr:biotin holocarboxylase synthetase [Friedmanniomyces endolithicus]KAK0773210.1 biotin holocarboxylase synthetase [Friedmanniomyces endolithicus]KAK0779649.1 biotin holocarboxylase synthetase [Friedmanniomyces endolithicus]KAK0780235.1 biotin holocarboxylase synthetase [Friedmanniomyces endolithicus]KAK0835264.1 biotin holocarboxylase synthetase [Friedmanniomyces endolithicus]
MSAKRVNVLVYAGGGTTLESVRHATWSLRRLLGPNYAVLTVTGDQILKEPWAASCTLLVMPGGADLGYCRTLNGEGNRRIKQYVQMGGSYLGLCAGGYYGCSRCEFEVGKTGMEVVGDRELGFFPGTCRGLAFPGFVYHSEAGTRAAELKVNAEALATGNDIVPESFRAYYNGGGVFVDAEKLKARGVEVLASYQDELAVESGDAKAAVVFCKVGEGAVILTGPHPEFSGTNLSPNEPSGHHDYPSVVSALVADEKKRVDFMKACLIKLGLEVNQETEPVPSLSRLHLSSSRPSEITELLHSWHEVGVLAKGDDGQEVIKGENDTFIVEQQGRWNMSGVKDPLPTPTSDDMDVKTQTDGQSADSLLDYNLIPKRLVTYEKGTPESKETPYFNHDAFFANLKHYNTKHTESDHAFGKVILYGEVVTSTNTLLDKNPTWLSHLPTGLTATATTQVAGRGRGTNVWVSPPGSLMFSTVLRHSLSLSTSAPVVFVQYIAALAIVAGIHSYDRGGYARLPVKLKWPNDIYALDPTAAESEKKYVKIGGILVNSSYAGGDYTLVCGVGLNVTNAAPTTSLSLLAKKLGLQPFTLEKLLASILTQFEELYTRFCRTGFDKRFLDSYYASWLHTDQIVTLETEGGARARIQGITGDWGMLVAEELGWEDRATGRKFQLQSDSNSFDFFRGLLKRKM